MMKLPAAGGTVLKHIDGGDAVYWLIVTEATSSVGYSKSFIEARQSELDRVETRFGFEERFELGYPTTRLDTFPTSSLVDDIGNVVEEIAPSVVYLPYRGDSHSDHTEVFDATASCTKWFRYPSVEKVLAYETRAETDSAIDRERQGFRPNIFVNIGQYLSEKVQIMNEFESEVGDFPFSRSEEAIRSLARLRGSSSGFEAAEAVMLLRQQIV